MHAEPGRLVTGVAASHHRAGLPVAFGRLRSVSQYAREICLLVVAYYAAAHLGYALRFSGPVAAIVWLPVGVAIAFLYLRGMRFWPGVVIGDLLVNNYAALPVGTALGQSFGNLIEVLVATALIRRLCRREDPTSSLPGVAGLVVAVAAGTFASALIGSVSSWLGSVISAGSLPHVLRTWWLGDFLGALVVVPLALSWSRLPRRPWSRPRVVEATLVAGAVVVLSWLALSGTRATWSAVFPGLIWAALRFGPRGATLAITTVAGFAVWATVDKVGPFAVGSIDRPLDAQVFIAAISLSGLAIAALVAEKEGLARGMRNSRARLVAASDQARRRLEHDLHDGAQQSLVGLRIRLDQAADVIARDPVEGRRMVMAIGEQVDSVLDALRALARGIYPSVLREHGVAEALRSAARTSPVPVAVQATQLGRYEEPAEVAVYFCCLEAIQNVVKHAGQAPDVVVRLGQDGGHLRFEVNDDGLGFDATTVAKGDGLASMRDRMEAVGGRLTVTSSPGRGTTVRGSVRIA